MTKPGHVKVRVTAEQRRNLRKLAMYLLGKLKAAFTMDAFTESDNHGMGAEKLIECGSIGCALGHAPYAGIRKKRSENWWEYGQRCFVSGTNSDPVWNWCFSSYWTSRDNTPDGAAKRIVYALRHGVPSKLGDCDYTHADYMKIRIPKKK